MTSDTPPTPKPALAAVLFTVKDPGGQEYYAVSCPSCGDDLSRLCVGRIHATVAGPVIDIFHPLRCSGCMQRLLPAVPVSRIVPARGRLT